MSPDRPKRRQETLQRGVIILPSAFTLGNLFFGVYAIVAASRGDFLWAGWFIIFAGVLDMLDGRVARFTRTGSAFGAELDSLVDAISFGVAPGYIMFELFFAAGAKRCYPMGHRMPVLESPDDLETYRKSKLRSSDLVWTAFHPLGTAQMGHDPFNSVVDLDHQSHDIKQLFIVDGSTLPGPTAVNPQLTIMALSNRAAERIDKYLD